MPLTLASPPPQAIYDTCPYCRLSIRPGEVHGDIAPGEDGTPRLICRIKRLQQVEEVLEAKLE